MSRPIVLLAAALLLAACASDREAVPSNDHPEGAPITVESEARLSVGVLEGDPMQEFHRVVTPFLLPGGDLVVPVSDARALRLFDGDGRFVRELGSRGEGPGEFATLDAAWARGDTIEAFDGQLRRITRFLPEGSVETVPLDPVGSAQTALPVPFTDGWIVFGAENPGMEGRDDVVVHAYRLDGSHAGEIARTVGFARYRSAVGGGPEPLSPRAVLAAHRDEVYVGETLTPRLEVLDVSGTRLRDVTWEMEEVRDPGATFRVVREAVEERDDAPFWAVTAFQETSAPDRVSAFWDLLVDAEGFFWIRPYEPLEHAAALGGLSRGAGPGGTWTILSREGDPAGTVTIPDGLEPLHITYDAVVGIHHDEWDVESVRVHDLRRSGVS